ncbi:MAG: hypothetical protein IVW54_00810 [Candidatus Binataceae bacterium]|nr:hypothetical protein [Candidatus Binataceae bacterium]
MNDDANGRTGALLEHLGARFDLVLEAVTGFGGGIDSLREEIRGQFTEVGRQIRFLSEQIAVNRGQVASLRQDLSAELVRLGEELGKSRVELGERIGLSEQALRGGITATQTGVEDSKGRFAAELTKTAGRLKADLNGSAETVAKKLEAEMKKANKLIAALDKKFERFDDRITIQTRDQEERVRKIERRGRG